MMRAFSVLARMKSLRGGPLDVFGWSAERKVERALAGEYEALLAEIAAKLTPANLPLAVRVAGAALEIKGFGPVKAASLKVAKAKEAVLLDTFRSGREVTTLKAAE
jgi:indolepyruvate ferredoxin oxidoreductase